MSSAGSEAATAAAAGDGRDDAAYSIVGDDWGPIPEDIFAELPSHHDITSVASQFQNSSEIEYHHVVDVRGIGSDIRKVIRQEIDVPLVLHHGALYAVVHPEHVALPHRVFDITDHTSKPILCLNDENAIARDHRMIRLRRLAPVAQPQVVDHMIVILGQSSDYAPDDKFPPPSFGGGKQRKQSHNCDYRNCNTCNPNYDFHIHL